MSSLRNRVQLIGRAGQNAEIIVFGSEKKRRLFQLPSMSFTTMTKVKRLKMYSGTMWSLGES